MESVTLAILVITGLVILITGLESFLHAQTVKCIPIRIHVNGTRGKSSVTRLIAAGLRAGGMRVLGKTTGVIPRLIMPDGREEIVRRHTRPNIIEQLWVFRQAKKHRVKALVIECMAIHPDLQSISEERIVLSTTGVITNVRLDHHDIWGARLEDVANAMSRTIPSQGGQCYTAEKNPHLLRILHDKAMLKGVELVKTRPEKITDEIMDPFLYLEHRDNVALALKVCEDFGVSRRKALEGFYQVRADEGALRTYHLDFENKQIEFANAFAANDTQSSQTIWDRLIKPYSGHYSNMILLNTRSDRIVRSIEFCKWISKRFAKAHVFLTGDNQYIIRRELLRRGIHSSNIISCKRKPVREIFRKMLKLAVTPKVFIFGAGNIRGDGYRYVQFFSKLEHKLQLQGGTA